MKVKLATLLICGAVLTLCAGGLSYRYTAGLEARLRASQAALAAYGNTVNVPILTRDVSRGDQLMLADFKMLKLPEAQVPKNAFRDLPDPFPEGGILAFADLAADELISTRDLGQDEPEGGAGYHLSQDGRALALSPNNLADFAPSLTVGERVDLVWTRSVGGGQYETRLLAAGLRILALPGSQRIPPSGEDKTSTEPVTDDFVPAPMQEKIVLEIPAEVANRIIQAQHSGSFYILPSAGPFDGTQKEYVMGPLQLQQLPMVVSGVSGAAAEAGASVNRLGRLGQVFPEGGGEAERKICKTAVIRGGARALIEVPC